MLTDPPTLERHQVAGEEVVRAVKTALDSLQRDLPSTGRVVATRELRTALRLLEGGRVDAP